MRLCPWPGRRPSNPAGDLPPGTAFPCRKRPGLTISCSQNTQKAIRVSCQNPVRYQVHSRVWLTGNRFLSTRLWLIHVEGMTESGNAILQPPLRSLTPITDSGRDDPWMPDTLRRQKPGIPTVYGKRICTHNAKHRPTGRLPIANRKQTFTVEAYRLTPKPSANGASGHLTR